MKKVFNLIFALSLCSLVSVQPVHAQDTIYYNAGGPQYISLAGDTFVVDLHYTPGATGTFTNSNIIDILGTDDDELFRTERSANTNGGDFTYSIPVSNGLYNVKLYFAEIFFGAPSPGNNNASPPQTGKRVFNVSIEGNLVLDSFDIVADVGTMTATIKEFNNVDVNDGALTIFFDGITNRPKVSALVISPISLDPPDSTNTAPTFTVSGNVTVDEDFAGTQTVTVTPDPVPPAESGQSVTYSLSPPSVAFANVSINPSTGNVSITKVNNGNGSQLFTITANDGQVVNNIATGTFTLTVNPVNDPPAFTTSGNITVNENFAGTQNVTVTPGAVPADETGQTVTYSLSPPSVAFANVSINTSSGLVSITSVADGQGSQLFTITADDGQGANNTAAQNFTLTVNDTTNIPPSAQGSLHYNAGGLEYVALNGDTFKVEPIGIIAGATSTFTNNNADIANTDDDLMFKTERSAGTSPGSFGYNVPVQNGFYTVKLYFAEIFFGAPSPGSTSNPPHNGKRIFDVSIEGALVLDDYDIVAEVGSQAAVLKQYDSVQVSDGNLDIDFASSVNRPKISAFSIIPISVVPPDTTNTPPAFSVSADVTVDEDFAGTQNVTVTPDPVPPGEAGQVVTYSLSPPSVAFANVSINPSTGLVSITKVNNGNGSQLFTITANDGQPANNIATQNFTLTVNPVNDAPAFTTSGNVTVNENFAGSQTVTVTPAAVPADEAAQVVAYSLTPPSVAFANVSINPNNGQVTITAVLNGHGSQLFTITANDGQGVNNIATQNFTLTVIDTTSAPQEAIYFNCGGPQYVTLAGDTFVPDQFYSSGTTVSTNNIVTDILGTDDDSLYRSERFKGSADTFTYNIPVQNGTYTINLHFAEIFFGVDGGNLLNPPHTNKRKFHVVLEGDSVLKNYDIVADVGSGTAVIKSYVKQVTDGNIRIHLDGVVNNAKISAISIIPELGPVNEPPTVSITAPGEGASFVEGTPIQIDADADDTDGTVSKVEFYENGNLLDTDFDAPYSFTWGNSTPGVKALTAKAFDDDNAPTTSSAVNITVTADAPPTVSITSPADGASFTEGQSIAINATADDDVVVAQVDFYAGVVFLGSDNTLPFSFNWTNAPVGQHALTAVAFDNQLQGTVSAIVNITVDTIPAGDLEALLVVGNLTLNNGDQGVKTRLEVLGFNVTLVLASASATSDANGKDLVLISSTVTSTNVGSKFTNVSVPVINWEQALHDDLGMTSATAGNSGTTSTGQTQLNIIGAGHPLAAGLPNGLTTIYAPGKNVTWGKPNANSVKIATTSGSAVQIALFGYETGVAMVTGNAPARRVGLFLSDDGAAFLTASGTALLDAAITWAANSTPPTPNELPTVSITNPADNESFIALANITIEATANDPDGSISKVEFYQGLNLLGTDFDEPYSFNWNGVGAGNYQLTAKAYDNIDASTTSAVVNINVDLPPNDPPTVSITNPADNAEFIAPANIIIEATANDPDGSISKVEFYAGVTLLGTDFDEPYSINWLGVTAGNYQLTAKAYDNLNVPTTSAIINVEVEPGTSLGTILLVVGNLTLNSGDAAVKSRLETLGYTVEVKLASASATGDATGKTAVLISSTVTSGDVGSKFTNVAVPVMNWEHALHKDLKLVNAAGGNSGTVSSPNLSIIGAGHPLAASLPNGTTAVYSSTQTISWGKPSVNAAKIATTTGSASNIVIFGYEVDATMVGLNAPARRVGFFLQDVGAAFLNANGTALFDAAINWLVTTPVPNNPPTVSITSPANNDSFLALANFSIDATANDGDGSILKVEFYEGLNLLGTDNDFPYSFNWTNVPAGNYQLTAKAFDNQNATTTSAIINVSVNPPANVPPTVSITSPADNTVFTALANINIITNAADSDGSISKVEFYEGLNLIGTDNTAPTFSFNWQNVPQGSYQLTAKAFDNINATTTSAVVNVVVNNLPTVSITSPANGVVLIAPATFNIDATASDVGGTILKVEFYQGVNLLGTDFDAPYSFPVNNLPQGSYQYTAKAFDNLNATTTSTVVNVVVNNLPTVNITAPANGTEFTAPANFNIDAIASDVGGSISKVEFYNGVTLLGTDFGAPYTWPMTNVPQGGYQFTAKAFDNLGATTTSSVVNVTVNPGNQAPIVSITAPAHNTNFNAPANVGISASAVDNDGTIAKVEFYVGATLLGTDFTFPYALNWNGVGAGNYNLTAKAFDNLGATTTSAIVSISVNPPGNNLPTVSITNPANNTGFTAPANILIEATAADVGGSISKVEFYNGVNLLGTDNSFPYSFNWTNVPAGNYQLTAKAFDNLNATTVSAIVNVQVNPLASLSALFVVGNPTLGAGDAAVKTKLESMGYTVTVVSDAASNATQATGKTIVLISSTVAAGNVNTKFTNVAVPLINWESGIMDDLKLTGIASSEFGTAFNQTQINITGAGHPLAASLPNGLTTVFTTPQTVSWGKPNGNAVSIAAVAGDATRICIFGYTSGAAMVGINAPARRVGFMLADVTPASLNTAGMQLLEAAILWASGASKSDDIEAPGAMQSAPSFDASVYPNPSTGVFNIRLDNATEGKLTVAIYNYSGQAVYLNEKIIDSGAYTERFDFTEFPSGLYLIQITGGESILTRRVFISR